MAACRGSLPCPRVSVPGLLPGPVLPAKGSGQRTEEKDTVRIIARDPRGPGTQGRLTAGQQDLEQSWHSAHCLASGGVEASPQQAGFSDANLWVAQWEPAPGKSCNAGTSPPSLTAPRIAGEKQGQHYLNRSSPKPQVGQVPGRQTLVPAASPCCTSSTSSACGNCHRRLRKEESGGPVITPASPAPKAKTPKCPGPYEDMGALRSATEARVTAQNAPIIHG